MKLRSRRQQEKVVGAERAAAGEALQRDLDSHSGDGRKPAGVDTSPQWGTVAASTRPIDTCSLYGKGSTAKAQTMSATRATKRVKGARPQG